MEGGFQWVGKVVDFRSLYRYTGQEVQVMNKPGQNRTQILIKTQGQEVGEGVEHTVTWKNIITRENIIPQG